MRGLLRHDYGEDNMDEPVDHASIAGHFERELIAARAEIDKLRESCEAYKGQVQAGAAEIERLQEAKRRALAAADERSKENVALKAALKPFAEIAALVQHTPRRDGERVFELPRLSGGYYTLMREDFSRAAAAYRHEQHRAADTAEVQKD